MWFSNHKSCGQDCLGRIYSIKALQYECSAQVMRNVCRQIKMETSKTFGINKSEKTVHLEGIVLPTWFLTKLMSVKCLGFFAVAVTCEVCVGLVFGVWFFGCVCCFFSKKNAIFSLSRPTWFWPEDNLR